jgi:hypothetical protein
MMKKHILTLLLCSSCAIFSGEKQLNGIFITQEIFLDGSPSSINITVDGVVPSLKESTIAEVQSTNLLAQNHNADILLKVRTKFYGEVPVSKKDEILENDINIYDIDGIKQRPEKKPISKSKIDKLIEDPSGMIVGFAVGIGMSNPMVSAPIGMALGAGVNLVASTLFEEQIHITILEIEIHEKAKKPMWYTDKRIHKKDEHSIRKYEYSEETQWKVYKTRVVVQGKHSPQEVAKRIASLVM